NVTAGTANVGSLSSSLNLGRLNLSGDPTFWSTLDITLTSDQPVVADNIALLAGRNINLGNFNVNTHTTNGGFNITIVAGANLTAKGTVPEFPTKIGDGATVTVSGPSGSGGNITSDDGEVIASGGTGNAGNVLLAAF